MHCTSGIVYRVSFTLSLTRGAVRSYNWPIGSIVIALCEARPQYDDAAKHCPPRELFPHLPRRGPPDPEKVIEAPHKSSSLSGFDSRECFSPAAAAALASRPLRPTDRPNDRPMELLADVADRQTELSVAVRKSDGKSHAPTGCNGISVSGRHSLCNCA